MRDCFFFGGAFSPLGSLPAFRFWVPCLGVPEFFFGTMNFMSMFPWDTTPSAAGRGPGV